MKKLIFLLPVAALWLASCSNDKVVEQNPSKVVEANALQIYPEIQGLTRGYVWDNSNFTEFKLNTSGTFQEDGTTINSGDAELTGVTVRKSGSTWSILKAGAATTYYWPNKSATSDFTAWAPTDATTGAYTASTTIADQEDILVAFNSGSATDFEAGVPLKFRHILSQIVIKADNAAKNKIQIKVKDVRINNISSQGTWSLPTTATTDALGYTPWTEVQTSENYLTDCGETTLDGSSKNLTGAYPLLLIPQDLNKTAAADIEHSNGQYISVLVQIQKIKTGDETANTPIFPKGTNATPSSPGTVDSQHFAWAAVALGEQSKWEPGKKYIYTLHFTENGYGKVDDNQQDGDTDDGTGTQDPDPGEDVVDAPVKLVLDVEVIDWTNVTEEHNM